jgi:hypothetical protein
VRNLLRLGRDATSPLRAGKLIMTTRLQDGGHSRDAGSGTRYAHHRFNSIFLIPDGWPSITN